MCSSQPSQLGLCPGGPKAGMLVSKPGGLRVSEVGLEPLAGVSFSYCCLHMGNSSVGEDSRSLDSSHSFPFVSLASVSPLEELCSAVRWHTSRGEWSQSPCS